MDQHAIVIANSDGVIQLWSVGAEQLCSDGQARPLRGQLHLLRDESRKAIGAMAIFAAR